MLRRATLNFTRKSRVADEVEYFSRGLEGAPLDPERLRAADRFLLQFAHACATGAAISGICYLCYAIKHTVSQ